MLPEAGQAPVSCCAWPTLLVLLGLLVVTVIALNSTVAAFQHHAALAKLNAPPRQLFRDVDSSTSGDQLTQQTQCPPTAPSGLVTRVGGSIQPFIVLHELHVGEQWLVRLLQVRRGSPRRAHTPRCCHDVNAPLAGTDRRARTGGAGQGRQGPEGGARVALRRHEHQVGTRYCSPAAARLLVPKPHSTRRSHLPTPLRRPRAQTGRVPAAARPPAPTPPRRAQSGSCSLRVQRAR